MEDHDKSKNDPSRPVEPQISIEAAAEPTAAADLPFLVTHWLANYNNNQQQESTIGSTPEERNAIQRIRRAASELSSAFHALGSFGTTTRVSLPEMNEVCVAKQVNLHFLLSLSDNSLGFARTSDLLLCCY